MSFYQQQVGDSIEYTVDVSDWTAGGATISGATWSASGGATVGSDQINSNILSAILSGVTCGTVHKMEVAVALSTGETFTEVIPVIGINQ